MRTKMRGASVLRVWVAGSVGADARNSSTSGTSSAIRRRNVCIGVTKFIYCRDRREREIQKGSR